MSETLSVSEAQRTPEQIKTAEAAYRRDEAIHYAIDLAKLNSGAQSCTVEELVKNATAIENYLAGDADEA